MSDIIDTAPLTVALAEQGVPGEDWRRVAVLYPDADHRNASLYHMAIALWVFDSIKEARVNGIVDTTWVLSQCLKHVEVLPSLLSSA